MNSDLPEISVVVATRNRAARLESLLDTLRAQRLDPHCFEVVVVDDASDDSTPQVLYEAHKHGGFWRFHSLRRHQEGGPAAARNEGWRAAKAPLVAFTDDDCEAHPGWLEAVKDSASANPGSVIQGYTEPIPDERERAGLFSRTLEITELGPNFETCNMAYPREMLDRLDGFDEAHFPQSGEDTDLAWRAMEIGAKVVFADRARVYHAVNELGPIGKLRLALRWSDAVHVFARHPVLKRRLWRGYFWNPSHSLLLLALLGVLLACRVRPAIVLTLPYMRQVRGRLIGMGVSPLLAPYQALYDLLETYAVIRGALRSRVLVL